jgi:hypothetical protein
MKKTILLVEDSKVQKLACERVLFKAGYLVLFAGDGEEALRLARESVPDLSSAGPAITGDRRRRGPAHTQSRLLRHTSPQRGMIFVEFPELRRGWRFDNCLCASRGEGDWGAFSFYVMEPFPCNIVSKRRDDNRVNAPSPRGVGDRNLRCRDPSHRDT